MRVSPVMLRWLSAAGLAMSLLGAVAWYAAWVPFVNLADPRWLRCHADAEICAQIARVQPMWGWTHDMTLQVGCCGPEWVGTILAEANEPEILDSTDSHLGESLRRLTGQAIPEKDLEAWRRWYAEHQHESQGAWIRGAFAHAGVEVPAVLTSSDVRVLLKWIGEKHSESEPPRYAAFILLRDQDAMRELLVSGPDSPMTPAEVVGFRCIGDRITIENLSPCAGKQGSSCITTSGRQA